jgi:hypothetical protein
MDYYSLYLTLENLSNGLKLFLLEKSMTTEFLQGALNWADLRYPIKHMRTPKRAARKYAIQMNELRTLARSIASEKERVQGLIEEAILRLQESKVMILAWNFLHSLPDYRDESDPASSTTASSTLNRSNLVAEMFEPSENSKEEAEGNIERWSWRDQTSLNPDIFDPVWINGEEFPGEMPEEVQEIVADGRGKYS